MCVVDALPYARPGAALWVLVGDSPPTLEALVCDDGVQRLVMAQTVPARGGRATVRRTIEWSRGVVRWSDEVHTPHGARVVQYTQLPDDVRSTGPTTLRAEGLEYHVDGGTAAELELVTVPWSERYGSIGAAQRAVVAVTATTGFARLAWSARCT